MANLVYPLVDSALAAQLERAEAAGCLGFVEARARVQPEVGSVWREIGGTFCMFDGPASPITQTFHLGMAGPVHAAHLDEIESFYRERGAPVFHEVSPLADDSVLALLNTRGYRPVEFTSVMFRPLGAEHAAAVSVAPGLSVRVAGPADAATFVETSVGGWNEFAEYRDMLHELAMVNIHRTDARSYLVELHGRPIATGGMSFHDQVAICAGASTLPDARGKGAQLALLNYRLHDAARAGYTLAMMCARPGSGSQRNAERHGFRIAYTRIKWQAPHA